MLSEHFTEKALGINGEPEQVYDNAVWLCERLLEPIRAHYGRPLIVHDGYRAPEHNEAVGGVQDSYHLYEFGHAAADFHIDQTPLTEVFNWIRLESGLEFDKVILEHDQDNIPRCIHIQVDRLAINRRKAYIGATNGRDKNYIEQEVK